MGDFVVGEITWPTHSRRYRIWALGALLALASLCTAQATRADDYPTRPVRIILGFAAGRPTDILSRSIADQLSKSLGVPMVVENRLGAGGNIAASAVARATADGYTLLIGGTNYVIGHSWYKNIQFDILKDLQIVSTLSQNPNVLVVNPTSELKTLDDVVQKARSEPGHLTFASSGAGTVVHLAGEIFKSREKVDMRHVPYSGTTLPELDLMGGRVAMMFDSLAVALPFIKENKLRAIGVTSKDRSSYAPEIPTLAEQGLKGYDISSWYAVWAPAGVPKDIVDKLNRAIVAALATPEMKARLVTLQAEAFGNTPEAADQFQREELAKWTKAVELLGPRPE
jgi:tripartite-type tricarboxylate transporter receptor subunit TctC